MREQGSLLDAPADAAQPTVAAPEDAADASAALSPDRPDEPAADAAPMESHE